MSNATPPGTTPMQEVSVLKSMQSGLRYPRFLWLIGFATGLHAATWGILYWLIPPTEADVVLHYNIYFGVDLIGGWEQLLLIPITGASVLVLNALLALYWQAKEPVLAAIVEFGAVIIQLLCIVALVTLYFQNYV